MKNKQLTREITADFAVILLTILALVLFGLGFSTGYYLYGQMNSVTVTVCYVAALLLAGIAILCLIKLPKAGWPKLLTYLVTAGLALGALTLLGDRVEGIGNCILTDYDSGHGGEEAIYYSLGSVLAALAAMIFNIIGSFGRDPDEEKKISRSGRTVLCCACALTMIAILVPSLYLGGAFAPQTAGSSSVTAANKEVPTVTGTYKVVLSGAETNLDMLQDYQFQCGKMD